MKNQSKPFHPYMSEVSKLESQGRCALSMGDTELAREKYGKAGDIIARSLKLFRSQEFVHDERIFAATAYFQAGLYTEAWKQLQRIEPRFLDERSRQILEDFLPDVRERNRKSYLTKMRHHIHQLWKLKKHEQIIEILKTHPYIYDRVALAFFRAVNCVESGSWRAGNIFYADALKWRPLDRDLMFLAGCAPLNAIRFGNDALIVSQHTLKLTRNAWSVCVAAGIVYLHAMRDGSKLSNQAAKEFIELMDESTATFAELPDSLQSDPDVVNYYNASRAEADALKQFFSQNLTQTQLEESLNSHDPSILISSSNLLIQREESLISESLRLAN
jgi:tetratricopeptide (TPR) repeat protein